MFTTFINDCRDDNARARQTSRVGSLLQTNLSFIGVDSDLEAGMQLIDILDATGGREGLILVNVAPRGGRNRKWENGTPFAYFWYKQSLIISSIDGFSLSAIKKLDITNKIRILDIKVATDTMLESNFITDSEAQRIITSQFRSFDFTPRLGIFMMNGNHIPSEELNFDDIPELPPAIWNIDNFGNCKTTLTPDDLTEDKVTNTRYGALPYFTQLHNVPDGEPALVKGSSGINDIRFIEVLMQRKDFAKTYNAKIGDDIFQNKSYFRTATDLGLSS